jgi:hypothetical protein
LINGAVTSFDPATVTPSRSPGHYPGVFFRQATATRIDLLLDELHFHAAWSQFEVCTFRQKTAPASPGGVTSTGVVFEPASA